MQVHRYGYAIRGVLNIEFKQWPIQMSWYHSNVLEIYDNNKIHNNLLLLIL